MSTVNFRVARTPAERADVLRLRDAVYVQDQGRLADATDTAETFDRFDAHAEYILAYDGDQALGTVKIVPDSAAGLPCDDVVDLTALRARGRLVEFGHLMTLPQVRGQEIGMSLMRQGLVHSVAVHGATHVLGDFFVDDGGGLRGFYRAIGFVAMHEPYEDVRFQGAPLSLVGMLDVRAAAALAGTAAGADNRLLQYFFHDYDDYAKGRQVVDTPSGTR
ncbi:N-acyl amino acid synthase FeeM domain-containing protein [Kitasatospora sp. NPDC050543]|uniref:N-acyl amino acid synthase FeeM domain-containing protein n=1 Tax=Kitasatospora sp. NPDC050543 TaxID=3364054 RepID=UPI0037B5008D